MGINRHPERGNNLLAENITLSNRDASDTVRLLKLLSGTKPAALAPLLSRVEREESLAVPVELTRHAGLVGAAKQALICRRVRSQFLDPSMFGEPGWDMLLALYITDESDARNSIARLTDFSGASPTTALRWISHLEELGLVHRVPHPTDLRTTFIELTADARQRLTGYFYRVEAMGLAA